MYYRSWNHARLFAVSQTEHAKIAPIQSEDRLDPITVRQMHQRCIGKLYAQAWILGEDCGDAREIRLAKSNQLKVAYQKKRGVSGSPEGGRARAKPPR